MRDRDKRYVDLVFDHYGWACACCNEKESLFLTIDHINNDGFKHRNTFKQYGGIAFYRWVVRNNFPKDLQTLCANCNSGKHRNGGICPHQEDKIDIKLIREWRKQAGRVPAEGRPLK